jgi:hypothetical protein
VLGLYQYVLGLYAVCARDVCSMCSGGIHYALVFTMRVVFSMCSGCIQQEGRYTDISILIIIIVIRSGCIHDAHGLI